MIERYNILLKEWIEQQQASVILFDAYAFDTEIHNKILEGGYPYHFDGKPYILKYGGDLCYHDHAEISCYFNKGNYQEQVSPICPDPTDYFYYDRAHPTTFVHKLMSDAVYAHMQAHQKLSQGN